MWRACVQQLHQIENNANNGESIPWEFLAFFSHRITWLTRKISHIVASYDVQNDRLSSLALLQCWPLRPNSPFLEVVPPQVVSKWEIQITQYILHRIDRRWRKGQMNTERGEMWLGTLAARGVAVTYSQILLMVRRDWQKIDPINDWTINRHILLRKYWDGTGQNPNQ